MSDKDNGGAAFPVVHPDGMGVQYFGISVRDYFAAKAMPELISHYGERMAWAHDEIASESYRIADAMLEARK